MSLLVDGILRQDEWLDNQTKDGHYVRRDSQFRHWVTSDGAAGPSGDAGFKAESGRYHLYVSYACPWAHRTLIFRQIKQLETHISFSVVSPDMLQAGWSFDTAFPGSTGETLYGLDYMHQIYTKAQSNYSGIVTVPVLWDKQQETIVNNESSEIIRMLNSAFNELTGNNDDYYPQDLRAEIDSINQRIYDCLNNGVYRCGFAATQAAYDEAFDHLFDTLDFLETHLSQQRYLVGEQITEADLRLIPTLLRFDPVYVGHFKCNRQRISDFDNLSNYTRDLYQQLDLSKTTYFDHIKRHYYFSHEKINPTRIVPKGPNINLELAHDRNRF